jgi:ABC-type transport system involved in Fe-S cluster assembly fused permease/ATPase subunit
MRCLLDLSPSQEKILDQLITQERMLSELYRHFSKQFSEHEKFWHKLSLEEERHAKLVQKLFDAAKNGKIFFDERKITIFALDAFISRLDGILQKAKNNGFTISTALICAVDYETSLIEKNIFSHFDSQSEKVKRTLKMLHAQTMNHVELIKQIQQAQKK